MNNPIRLAIKQLLVVIMLIVAVAYGYPSSMPEVITTKVVTCKQLRDGTLYNCRESVITHDKTTLRKIASTIK